MDPETEPQQQDLNPAPERSAEDIAAFLATLPQLNAELLAVLNNARADVAMLNAGQYIGLLRSLAAHAAELRKTVADVKDLLGKAEEAAGRIRQALLP